MLKAATQLLRIKQARDDLVLFTEVTMPHPEFPDDPLKTKYDAQYFHKALAAACQEVAAGRLKRLIVTFPPRHGKQFADSTPVLTPTGWTTHGKLRPGDFVFGADGQPTRVVAVSGPSLSCVEVEFTDGSSVRTHPDHEWLVHQRGDRKWVVTETRTLMGRKLLSGARKPRATYQVPLRPCVEFPEAKLPVPPYVFGAWLGDGTSGRPIITHAPQETEVVAEIADYGYSVSAVWTHATTGVLTTAFSGGALAQDLRDTGAFHAKHIPHAYKFASVEQRLQLLAGLTDTDGHVEAKTNRVRIATVNETLADDIAEVVWSLGWHPCKYEQAPTLSSSGIQGTKPVFYVGFQPTMALPTQLPRKRVTRFAPRRRVGFKAVRPCAPEIGRCIQVEATDGLYLIGRELIVTHNSELTTKRLPAWFIGRQPWKHVAVGTYNATFAEDIGRAVKTIINSASYKKVFPGVELKRDSQAADRQDTTADGALYFVGRGGAITGRGADLIIIDDPLKNSEEADSAITREALWAWFNNDMMSRFMTDEGAIIVIQTRWSEDDLVGRLTDPTNPCYVAEEAAQWKIINIPAIAGDDDLLGRASGEPLWPSRFGLEYLLNIKRRNPRGFSALYQQRPTPDDGDFFKAEYLQEYLPQDAPSRDKLRIYMASDHAVATKQENDRTCILVVGVDTNDNIWVLDCFWKRAKSDEVVEKLIDMMVKWKPLRWWAEDDHITKSIGPFLKKRMRERNVWLAHSKVNAYADKLKKAQAIQGRMSMQMVFFPKKASWWQDARDEILKFPRARHDDFVDTLSTIGRGLGVMTKAAGVKADTGAPKPGTWGWMKQASKDAERERKRRVNFASM